MQAVKSRTQADLAIFVQNQVSNYNYDETEEVGVSSQPDNSEGSHTRTPKTEQEQLIYEKRYENRNDIPYGLFFWEANQKLKSNQNTMNRLWHRLIRCFPPALFAISTLGGLER